VVHATVVDD